MSCNDSNIKNMSKKIKIAILTGGLSNEREVSLKTGKQVFNNLSNEKYEKYLIEMTSEGRWLLSGSEKVIENNNINNKVQSLVIMDPNKGVTKNDLQQFNVVFLALHGKYGEDGKIQSILDILDVPYTGSGVLASSLGMNKAMTMEFAKGIGIKTPEYILINVRNDLNKVKKEIISKIGYPCIVKPNESGSSIGISLVRNEESIDKAFIAAFEEDDEVLIQKFVKGREITCGVLGNSNKTELEALPPAEIIADSTFFDYDAKYFSEKTKEISPAEITETQIREVQNLAKMIHYKFGCDGLTRSDFILKDDKFYFLEINTLPGLTEQSLCPKEAKAAGMTFSEFLDKQIKLALHKK